VKNHLAVILSCFVVVVSLSGCLVTKRGVKEDNIYFSNQHPNVQIKIGENFEYHQGQQGEFQHQFVDLKNHRTAFIHVLLHPANQTQVDYYDNPEHWIYAIPPGSVELDRFVTEIVGEKWFGQDFVYHYDAFDCVLMRDLAVFTDSHDILKLRYSWKIPSGKCDQWKTITTLPDTQQAFLTEFREGFAEDISISQCSDEGKDEADNEQLDQKAQALKVFEGTATLQGPQRGIIPPEQPAPGAIKKVAIFPWLFEGDSASFAGVLKENIKYYVDDSDELSLEKSFYKIKKVARLNVPGSKGFYNGKELNLDLIKKTSIEEGVQIAVLGRMNIHCRWADNCQVREMETFLFDVETGEVERVQGSSWNLEAKEVIDSSLGKLFRQYITY